ncbi:MAG: hypothetical protein Q8O61_03190 [Nocardioides sp.]|nr:hypothetical protein [Nocardioides sp.]
MLMSLRSLVTALMGSLFFIAFALYFVVSTDEGAFEAPPAWVLLVQVGAGLVLHVLISAVGYRTAPITPGTPPEIAGRTSVAAMSTGTILRGALSESVAIASLALAFIVTEGPFVTYLGGAVVSLLLFALHAYPSERTISRTEASLERDGGTSYLRRRLGLSTRPPGAIEEL